MSRYSIPGYDNWKTSEPDYDDPADYECRTCGENAENCECSDPEREWVKIDNSPDDYYD